VLELDYKNPTIWLRYAELEMKSGFLARARNVWDRAVTLLPRVDALWYKYVAMEEVLGNAANAAGLANDIAVDALSRQPGNERVLFVHAAPGVVATNWGTEMPFFIRAPLRALQAVAPLRSPAGVS
jgi:hypothetical protein